MTLEEAINRHKRIASACETLGNTDRAIECRQIAEWLSLLKAYTDTGMAKEVQRARHEMHGWQLEWKREMERRKELEAENAKLRDKYDGYEQKMDAFVWTITGGLLSKSASTPNDVLCSTAEESLTKRLQSENAKLRDAMYTNAGKHALQHMDEDELRIWATQQAEHIEELRELVRDMCVWAYIDSDCDLEDRFADRMRELGIEVDE